MYTGSVYHAYTMLGSVWKAKSTDPVKVAAVMEGMKFNSFNGEVEMRKTTTSCSKACSFPSGKRPAASTPSTRRTPATPSCP